MGDTKKKSRDPLDCTMSLGDHLEELRARLILAILGLFIGAVVSLAFGTRILHFIESPYNKAVAKRIKKSKPPASATEPNTVALFEQFFTNLDVALASDPNAPALDPNRVAFFRAVCMDTIRAWTLEGAAREDEVSLPHDRRLQVIGVPDAFTAYMKISLISGLILTCPWVFYQLWMFVAAGLYEHERKYVRSAVPFSAALFIIGALFFLFVIAKISLNFFLYFGDLLGVASNWTLQKYVSFVTMLMLVFGLAFQTPIAIFILARTGLVELATLRKVRKYVFLSVFIISAAVTPPDVISQITLALPLYALYEVGMILPVRGGHDPREDRQQESRKEETRGIRIRLMPARCRQFPCSVISSQPGDPHTVVLPSVLLYQSS